MVCFHYFSFYYYSIAPISSTVPTTSTIPIILIGVKVCKYFLFAIFSKNIFPGFKKN